MPDETLPPPEPIPSGLPSWQPPTAAVPNQPVPQQQPVFQQPPYQQPQYQQSPYQQQPPPYYQQQPPVLTGPPAPRRPRFVLPLVITLASLVVVALIAAAIAGTTAAVTAAQNFTEDTLDLPALPPTIEKLVEGEPASPIAVEPDACEDPCFGPASLEKTVPDESAFNRLGLTETIDEWGDYASSSPEEERKFALDYWDDVSASPNECFFNYITVPVVASVDGDAPVTGRIDYSGTRSDEDGYSTLSQSIRVFDSSAEATEHMLSLEKAIAGCTGYEADGLKLSVTAAPAIAVPDQVAAIGWREASRYSRYYVYDVQRGNIVVRSTLSTDGSVTEREFRAFIKDEARLFETFNP